MAAAVKRFQKTPTATNELLLESNNIPDVVSLYNLLKSSGLIQTNKNVFNSKIFTKCVVGKNSQSQLVKCYEGCVGAGGVEGGFGYE